jgi:acyl-CoA reductase-like NAD-dependent aldehyde dehydrogenase
MSGTPITSSHYIGGEAVDDGGDTFRIHDPSDGSPLADVPVASADTVAAAVEAAIRAQRTWAATPLAERAAHLLAAADRVSAAVDELAELDVRETGKPIALARSLAGAAAVHIREFVDASARLDVEFDGGHRQVHDPYGVVGMIVPWNAPIEVVMRTLPAILLVGNTLVVKPSERAPLAVRTLVERLGLPAGLVNVVLGGPTTGAALVGDPRLGMVVHTGSVESGRAIAVESARHLRPVLLELGGKDAVIVDRDVDVTAAAELVALGSFINTGQLCTAIERIYVHRDVAEPFVAELVRVAEAERVGPGADPDTTLGPLIDERQRQLVHSHVVGAVEQGATLLTGGAIVDGPGCYYPPTVLTGCHAGMSVMRDETFGPIAAVQVVDDVEHALAEVNASRYGLAATVLSNDPRRAELARRVQAGTVWVNTYLVGTPGAACQPQRQSGLGVVGDRVAVLRAVSSPKTVHVAPVPLV